MSDAHTPGPWIAPRSGLDGEVYTKTHERTKTWRICDRIRGQTDAERAANTRLIALAPELLVIARTCATDCAGCGGMGKLLDGTSCPDCEPIRDVLDRYGL